MRMRYANITSTLALALAVTGGAYAATALPTGSVGTAQLQSGAVTTAKLGTSAVTASKMYPHTIGSTQINSAFLATLARVGHVVSFKGANGPSPTHAVIDSTNGFKVWLSATGGATLDCRIDIQSPVSGYSAFGSIVMSGSSGPVGPSPFIRDNFTGTDPAGNPPPVSFYENSFSGGSAPVWIDATVVGIGLSAAHGNRYVIHLDRATNACVGWLATTPIG